MQQTNCEPHRKVSRTFGRLSGGGYLLCSAEEHYASFYRNFAELIAVAARLDYCSKSSLLCSSGSMPFCFLILNAPARSPNAMASISAA